MNSTDADTSDASLRGVLARLTADRWTVAVVCGLVLVAVVFVTSSLGTPEVETFVPTAPSAAEVGAAKVGPVQVTVDASGIGWRFFDFSRGSVVERPGPVDWDLGVNRFRVIVNGGTGFEGRGGILELGELPFEAVAELPEDGYAGSVAGTDSTHAVLEDWYDYSWTSHLLTPRPVIYALRTADGRFAKLQVVGYYCEGAQPGCLTFRYVYQGEGGRDVSASRAGRRDTR